MSLSTLKDRVRAATTEQPTAEATVFGLAEDAKPSTPEQLHTSAQAEGGDIADVALNWLERYGNEFTRALPSHIDTGAFLAAVRAALPGLVRCTPASLLQALLTCARFGLIPDGRHAVIRREGKQAVFVPMAQGYVELMYRSGRVGSVHVGMIHEGDEWNFEPTAPAPLDFTHRPALTLPKKDRGEAILAYAFCWMASGARSQVVILTRRTRRRSATSTARRTSGRRSPGRTIRSGTRISTRCGRSRSCAACTRSSRCRRSWSPCSRPTRPGTPVRFRSCTPRSRRCISLPMRSALPSTPRRPRWRP